MQIFALANHAVKAGVVCLQVKLCDPHLSALEVRFSRRGAIQIYVYLTLLWLRSVSKCSTVIFFHPWFALAAISLMLTAMTMKVNLMCVLHCLSNCCLCFLQVNPYLLQNAVGAFSPFLAQALAGHQGGYSEIAVGTDCTGATSSPLTVMVPANTAYTPPSRSHRSDRMEAWISD